MTRVRLTIALALFSLAAVGCGGGDLVLPNEGQAAKVIEIAGDAQTGTILAPAAESLVVRVVDRFDNPVSGVEVSWSPQGGGDVLAGQRGDRRGRARGHSAHAGRAGR